MKLKMLEVATATLICMIILVGCGGKIAEDARKVEEQNEQLQTEEQKQQDKMEKDIEEMEEFYSNLENKDIDEIVQENELDQVSIQENIEVKEKEVYQNPNEFAAFVADTLYHFYNRGLTAEDYYDFLQKYGSKTLVDDLPSKEDAVAVYGSIQKYYQDQNIKLDSYQITEVKFNRSETEGYFYRKVLSTNGYEYFICTIVKENGEWKFSEDSPSPPFEEVENTEYIEEGV